MSENILKGGMCPRCEARSIVHGSLSRTCRSEGDPLLFVCDICGGKEALIDIYGKRYGLSLIHWDEWPLSIDRLVEEDRVAYEWVRGNG